MAPQVHFPMNYSQPDLSQHPPRSARVRLGGFVHFARLLDKARAHAAGRLGEYIWNCPLDQRFFAFTGVTADALLAAVKEGRSDAEMLEWLTAHQQPKRLPHEIIAWSEWLENLAPGDAQRHHTMAEHIEKMGPKREDIRTAFDRLDLDDYFSFGGKA